MPNLAGVSPEPVDTSGGFGQRMPNLAGMPPERVQEFYQAVERAKQQLAGQPIPDWLMNNLAIRYLGGGLEQARFTPQTTLDERIKGYLGGSLEQAYGGGQKLFAPGSTVDQRMQGASELYRGGMKFVAPFALPFGLAAAPAATLLGMGAGTLGSAGTEALGEKLGLPPGARALAGDVVGFGLGSLAGGFGPRALEEVPRALEYVRGAYRRSPLASERGSISFEPTLPKPGEVGPPPGLKPEEVVAKPGEVMEKLEEPEPAKLEERKEAAPRDVKARSIESLERRIPQQVRAVSPDPTKTINGQPFHSLDLAQPGEGFLPVRQIGPQQAEQAVEKAWNDAIQESEVAGGAAARKAVMESGARPPDASWWDKAFNLPLRSRYWYELGGETFTGKDVDLPPGLQPEFIDTVAATSGGVKPLANAKRAIGVLAEDVQKLPVTTDLRDPVSVRNALGGGGRTIKYRSFSGTMQYTSGLSTDRPLTVNDVQVADIFGIKGEDFGRHPILHEVMTRFFLKMRDMQNSQLAPGSQPWETWQMQAPAWVYNRLLKDPRSLPDDYSQVLPKIIQQLQAAGIPTPGGKITLETLMDPRTPNLMSTTRERFLGTPIATMEVASKLTPQGKAAQELYGQLDDLDPNLPWVRNAKQAYQQIQRNTMKALMQRKSANKELGIPAEPSLLSQLASAVVGRPIDVSRIDRMGYGTFEGEINPNMRVPMTGRGGREWISLDQTQREALLSMLGEDMQQEAMVSSLFETVKPGEVADTYSVFLRRGRLDEEAITKFSNQLGHPVNVTQAPNGVLIDVNMNFPDEGPRFGPPEEAVWAAARENFGRDASAEDIIVIGRKYDSNFVPSSQYEEKINAWKTARGAPGAAPAEKPGGAGRAGDTAQRVRDIARIRKKIQTHARVRDKRFADWTKSTEARLGKQQLARGQP